MRTIVYNILSDMNIIISYIVKKFYQFIGGILITVIIGNIFSSRGKARSTRPFL